MAAADCIPVISQVKSAKLYFKGDKHGAKETQKKFLGTCNAAMDQVPIASQIKSINQLVKGKKQKALKIQENFIKTPIITHFVPLVVNLVKSNSTKELEKLQFEAGDVIFCRFRGTRGLFCHHVMLATSNTTVAHCVQVSHDTAELRIEPWLEVISHMGFKKGFVNRKFCDYYFLSRIHRPLRYPGTSGVKRALADVDRFQGVTVHYDLFLCNCEHWVSYWVSGEALSDQAYILGRSGRTGPKSPI